MMVIAEPNENAEKRTIPNMVAELSFCTRFMEVDVSGFTIQAEIYHEKVVRDAAGEIGSDSYLDDLLSVDNEGLSAKTYDVLQLNLGTV